MNEREALALELHSLALFRGLLEQEVLQAFLRLLEAGEIREVLDAVGIFAGKLYAVGENWSRFLLDAVLEEENSYAVRYAKAGEVPDSISRCLVRELAILERASRIRSEDIRQAVGYAGALPEWKVETLSFLTAYQSRMQEIPTKGYGIFAKYHTFIRTNGTLLPVRHPDPVRLSMLSGYERERELVLQNTRALLQGKPAANTLLYGDAGTGKSTTVKAVVNHYRDQGLRLIELKKEQLKEIPELMDELAENPLKFILFIDDLSFTQNDGDFSALKAVLEGSVASRAHNVAVYATSNRRHLIRERFSDREGDEIHRGDTMQELVSLSDRFGLTVTFIRPDKQQYADIVTGLARRYGIEMEEELLIRQADAYAIRRSGYSPRVAKQFIESLQAG